MWESDRERERVVDRGVEDVLPKNMGGTEITISFQTRTLDPLDALYLMRNTLFLHNSEECNIIPISYRFAHGRKYFITVIPPGIPTVSHPTWNGKWYKLYHGDEASRFLINIGDIYKTTRS
jgi:hypothetical protein